MPAARKVLRHSAMQFQLAVASSTAAAAPAILAQVRGKSKDAGKGKGSDSNRGCSLSRSRTWWWEGGDRWQATQQILDRIKKAHARHATGIGAPKGLQAVEHTHTHTWISASVCVPSSHLQLRFGLRQKQRFTKAALCCFNEMNGLKDWAKHWATFLLFHFVLFFIVFRSLRVVPLSASATIKN